MSTASLTSTQSTAEAEDLQIEVPSVQRIAEQWGRRRWPAQAEHAIVPGLARELVGFLARTGALLGADENPVA